MCDLTKGRSKGCKDSIGGISKFYLMPFVDYTSAEFVVNNNVVTTFPNSFIYDFNFTGDTGFSNPMSENDGGKFYNENISIRLSKIGVDWELQNLHKIDYRAIILDRNGKYRLLGAYNGIKLDDLKAETGSAKVDFNGWTLQFTGEEERESLYLTDLTGFTIEDVDYNYLFEDSNNYLFEDDNNFIFN